MPRIQLRSILMDEYTQVRVSHDEGARADYADAYRSGEQLPRPVVFQDAAGRLRMADGHHRARAALDAGLSELDCDVRPGEARDAMIYAIRANGRNGLRWSTADKRRVINLLLDDPEFEEYSDRAIARLAGVDNKTVAAVRRPRSAGEIPQNPPSTGPLLDELPDAEAAPEDRIRECLRQGFMPYSVDGVAAAGRLVSKTREELDQEAFDRWIEGHDLGLRVDLLAAERVSNADVEPRDHIIGRFLRERDAVAYVLDPEGCEDLDGITPPIYPPSFAFQAGITSLAR